MPASRTLPTAACPPPSSNAAPPAAHLPRQVTQQRLHVLPLRLCEARLAKGVGSGLELLPSEEVRLGAKAVQQRPSEEGAALQSDEAEQA